MAKRMNVLTRYRLKKVVAELKDLQKDSKLNKIDAWDLTQATEMVESILGEKKPQDVNSKRSPYDSINQKQQEELGEKDQATS